MTLGAPESVAINATRIPSIAVLGADALLAALPATPVQLAHACLLAGYQSAVPASWGDELIAAAAVRALERHGQLPAIQCSCPYVAHRLLAAGSDLRPFLISLVAPPVALARYLRAAHGSAKVRITYVGRCPGAADDAIDARLTPEELLALFADRGVVLEEQPPVFDSVIPPDRRRFWSQPGGLPTPETLWSADTNGGGGARTLIELHGEELPVELAQHLLSGKPILIDVAGQLGCVCSGAGPGVDPAQTRSRVTSLEPPRSQSPIIDEQVPVDVELALPASARSVIDIVSPPPGTLARAPMGHASSQAEHPARDDEARGPDREERPKAFGVIPLVGDSSAAFAGSLARRHTPMRGITRPVGTGLPRARDANGKQLPRTYVARRRPPARGVHGGTSDLSASPIPPAAVSPPAVAVESHAGGNAPEALLAPIGPPVSETLSSSVAHSALTPTGGGRASGASGLETTETPSPAVRAGTQTRTDDSVGEGARYRERAVEVPVTQRSDASKRDQATAVAPTGNRPLAQLLVFSLLISVIVLVSAAVGVVVGRWMAQR